MTTSAIAGRATATVALAVVLTIVGANAASAHHCYRDDWADAAYQHHLRGGTAWISLSDIGAQFIIPPELQEQCGYVADDVVADFMVDYGLTQEPLIHSRAIVGSGAGQQGKNVPFSYLTEEQFETLAMDLIAGVEACAMLP